MKSFHWLIIVMCVAVAASPRAETRARPGPLLLSLLAQSRRGPNSFR